MGSAAIVFTTCPNQQEADLLANALVERKLAACVQASSITSTYRWEEKVEKEPEIRLIIKTIEERFGAIEACIKELSSYETPELLCIPVSKGSSEYLDWIESETL